MTPQLATLIMQAIRLLTKRVTLLRRKLILFTAVDHLGMDASPSDRVDDVVGCAESVTEIIKKVFPDTPIITGTWTLERYFWDNRRWRVTQDPRPGDIIIAATGTGNGNIRGHVGIVGENRIVMSSDSQTGKWMANYTIETFMDRYRGRGGFPVSFYTLNELL